MQAAMKHIPQRPNAVLDGASGAARFTPLAD